MLIGVTELVSATETYLPYMFLYAYHACHACLPTPGQPVFFDNMSLHSEHYNRSNLPVVFHVQIC